MARILEYQINYLIIFCFFFITVAGFSEQKLQQFSLKDAVDCVIRENLQLKREVLRLKETKLARDTSWNFLFPEASISAAGSQYRACNDSGKDLQTASLALSGNASWTLKASQFFDISQALISYRSGVLEYEQAKAEIETKTVQYYYLLQIEAQQIALQKLLTENSRGRFESAQRGYRNSEVSRIDLLRKEYDYRQKADALAAAENSYQLLLIRFHQLLNIPWEIELELIDAIPEPTQLPLELLEETDYQKNRSVFLLRQDFELKRLSYWKNVSQFFPYLSLSFSAGIDAVPSAKNSWQEMVNSSERSFTFRAAVTLPVSGIFPFSSMQVALLKGKNALSQAALVIEQEVQNQYAEKTAGLTEIRQLWNSCDRLKKNCDIALEAYQLSRQAYRAGELDYLALSDTESDYREAALGLLCAKYDLMMKVLDFGMQFRISLQQLGVMK